MVTQRTGINARTEIIICILFVHHKHPQYRTHSRITILYEEILSSYILRSSFYMEINATRNRNDIAI